jgi:hypothetical protein
MKNKELALNKLEQVYGALSNVKRSAYTNSNDLSDRFEKVEDLLEELESLIRLEQDSFLSRGYQGI